MFSGGIETWPVAWNGLKNLICECYLTPACIFLLKVNNRSTRTNCEICSKLTTKAPETKVKIKDSWRRSGAFFVSFEHISYLFLVFLLLTFWNYIYPKVPSFSMKSLHDFTRKKIYKELFSAFFFKCLQFYKSYFLKQVVSKKILQIATFF